MVPYYLNFYEKYAGYLTLIWRLAKLMVASWFVKLIWDLIFTLVRANHLTNRHPRSYFALIMIIQVNVIRKFYFFKNSKGTTRSVNWTFRFDGQNFETAGSSNFSHSRTLGMAYYNGKALTTGCDDSSSCYIKTEIMDMSTLEWSNGPDYSLAS